MTDLATRGGSPELARWAGRTVATESLLRRLSRHRAHYLMILPGAIFLLVFSYLPLWGLLVAFQDYNPFLGFVGSPWVGLAHFERLVNDPAVWRVFWNSLVIGAYSIALFFPAPIALALLLNEVGRQWIKRGVQTVVYMPHFLSWITVFGITFLFLANDGVVNRELRASGFAPVAFLQDAEYFRPLIVLQQIWRDAGWGAIIILAALTGINPELYEAAMMDGAGRWQQFRNITLPGIREVILVLLVLRLGTTLRTGFEQLYVMQNPLNYVVSDVLETYAFRMGIQNNQLSYAAAVGAFQSVTALVLVILANRFVKRLGGEGVW